MVYPQAAFGLRYATFASRLRALFAEHGGDHRLFFKKDSLVCLARRFSQSSAPDEDFTIGALQFSKFALFSTELVAWVALLLGTVRLANRGQSRILELRELYSRIVLMSLFQ